MASSAPLIDPRDGDDIAQQVRALLAVYAPSWRGYDPATSQLTGASAALIEIFARYCELIIQRLNRAPDKNFLAFLDLLGAARLPPLPAAAPLTFSLASGSPSDGFVPAGTQVAAPPGPGQSEPVVFETAHDLLVTAAALARIYAQDPGRDTDGDYTALVTSPFTPGAPVFRGNHPIEHSLYFGHSKLLGMSRITRVRAAFNVLSPLGDDAEIAWQIWDGAAGQDATANANPFGATGSRLVDLGPVGAVPLVTVNGQANRWLRAALATPVTPASEPRQGMVRASQLPQVQGPALLVTVNCPSNPGLAPDAVFVNAEAIEQGKQIWPFGARPHVNDTLYIASAEALSKDRAGGLAADGAAVSLNIEVARPHLLATPDSVRPSRDLQLAWECWNGAAWERVGTSMDPDWLTVVEVDPLPMLTGDAAAVVQGTAPQGTVIVVSPPPDRARGAVTAVAGDNSRFAVQCDLVPGMNVLAVSTPKSGAKSWAVTYRVTGDTISPLQLEMSAPAMPVKPEQDKIDIAAKVPTDPRGIVRSIRITSGSDGTSQTVDQGKPVTVALPPGRTAILIEGLDANNGTQTAVVFAASRTAPQPPRAGGFSDGTYGLTQSGTVTLNVPDVTAKAVVNGQENYWLRVRLEKGDYGVQAGYRLKNAAKPEDGFLLLPESYRPPVISSLRIGYQQELGGPPEAVFALNNRAFADLTPTRATPALTYAPFVPAPPASTAPCGPAGCPGMYFGLALPPGRTALPTQPISIFLRLEDVHYGEVSAPLWPGRSVQSANPGLAATHTFLVTNPGLQAADFEFAVLGTRWAGTVQPDRATLGPGETRQLSARVTVDPEATAGTSDAGFLRVRAVGDEPWEAAAEMVTYTGESPAADRLKLTWEYWGDRGWSTLAVNDETANLTRSGLLEFLPPPDMAPHTEFGWTGYWLRVAWTQGVYAHEPRMRRVLPNTTHGLQTVTFADEILGSSDAGKNQRYRTARAPVLAGQQLVVIEAEMPPVGEQLLIRAAEGPDALPLGEEPVDRLAGTPVRWHEVPDFYASGPRDRHYTLDHLTGEVRFGDGLNGLIPPVGASNIRMSRYRSGGGAAGNQPAGAIVQLKTTVPYVDAVTNAEPAAGGADAETIPELIERAPRTMRHRGQAVTREDYEDLAHLASPSVARALCVPNYDLAADPDGTRFVAGAVSLIVVPDASAPALRGGKPLPTTELLNQVQDYLDRRRIPTADLIVVGPDYVRVDVSGEVVLASLEGVSRTERAVADAIRAYLHPLTGGPEGAGWAFGRLPQRSDLYRVIEALPGVDHVRSLALDLVPDRPGADRTVRFLVYGGEPVITLIYEGG